ncbi:hypothetical protein CYFUS_002153 [Cystobacter fuscus]|uniref:Uncharacterized protein n=1 Tax=Cystobacter fuscus TaxID=43 RepID=A0A250IZP5_9BACT|nr:hypothetical protein CYFUS_002153 [Cystobacter fuscus]
MQPREAWEGPDSALPVKDQGWPGEQAQREAGAYLSASRTTETRDGASLFEKPKLRLPQGRE